MSASLSTFLFEAINFVVLAVLLGWFLFKPVRQALYDFRAQLLEQKDEVARLKQEAEQQQAASFAERQAMAKQLEQMRNDAQEKAHQEAEAILREGRRKVQQEREALIYQLRLAEERQVTQLAHAVAEVTHQIILHLLQTLQGPELQSALWKAACRQLATFSTDALQSVTIESAAPLDENAHQQLQDILGTHIDRVTYRQDSELIAGVRITTSQGLIDASILGLADFARQRLHTELPLTIREEERHASQH